LGGYSSHPDLLAAAYSSATWQKIDSALNMLEKFAHANKLTVVWPIALDTLTGFIDWAIFHKKLAPSSVKSYLSHIKLVHKLRGLDISACENFMCKTQLKGARNLDFYNPNPSKIRK